MQFNGIAFLLPIKNYIAILNLILTTIVDTGINYFFIYGTAWSNSQSPSIIEILIILHNILFGWYWILKKEFISCIANFIPIIISFILFLFMTCSSVGEHYRKLIFQILLITVVTSIIMFYIPENLNLRIVGIPIIISSIAKIILPYSNIISCLKKEEHLSFDSLVINIFFFVCYGGWLLFGLIIGDIYCIISNGITSLVWMISIFVICLFRYNKKKKDKQDKNKDVQLESSEKELEDKK
jgi:hypothetical protein